MVRAGRGAMRPDDGPMRAAGMPMGGPSEAELQAMLLQMREAPVEQVLAEVVNVLFQTIQVKLGLGDARTLIDVAAALAEATAGRIDPDLHGQVVQALAQLRLAQVEEEGRLGGSAPGGSGGDPEVMSESGMAAAPPDAARSPSSSTAPPSPGGAEGQSAASRLWVPGR